MVTKIVVVLCVFVTLTNPGVSSFPSVHEQELPEEVQSTDKKPSYVKMLHFLLHRLGYMPERPELHFSTTEGPDTLVSNSTEAENIDYIESIHKGFKLALDRLPPPPIHPEFHRPPLTQSEHRQSFLRFGPLIVGDGGIHQDHKTPVQVTAYSGRTPVTFERSGNGLSIHLNTKINFGGADVWKHLAGTPNLGPITLNNNIEFLFGREEKEEPKKEALKPAEPEYNYETYSDDEDYYDGSGEGSGSKAKITMDDEEGSGTTTIEPTEKVEKGTTYI